MVPRGSDRTITRFVNAWADGVSVGGILHLVITRDNKWRIEMKMVKSLLLGSAAGLVAVTAGQAADLPVKAKPVEYVKVCSLYGAGFYYIPGTDTCIKIGGFLRTEFNIHAAGTFAPFVNGGNALQTRTEDNYITRARALLTTDVREQTSYGTLRAYIAAGWQYSTDDAPTVSLPGATALASSSSSTFPGSSANGNLYLLRAFIQWGGFTFGKTASFYDFFNTAKYTYQTVFLSQDFGYNIGIFTYGYSQQLGNGLMATIAVQDPSPFVKPINEIGGSNETFDLSASGPLASTAHNAGTLVPDIVGSLRVDQAWGSAQVAAILHDDRATYYSTGPLSGFGHPDDKWGWAISGGFELKLPWGKDDTISAQSQYCVGASYACYYNSGTRLNDVAWGLVNPGKIGIGWVDDAYYTGLAGHDNSLQLPTIWNIIAAIQHYWVPEVRTSLYSGYVSYKANSSDVDQLVCAPDNTATHGAVSVSGCADWAAWMVGSRTIWNPTANLDIGVDVLYTSMAKSAFQGAAVTVNAPLDNVVTVGDTHIWAGILRIQYNFSP
jgi:Porin subfamily